MSNYPEGVTGFESQIVGAQESDGYYSVGECSSIGDAVVTRVSPTRVSAVVCGFEGDDDVPGLFVGDRLEVRFYWTCPQCGTENDSHVPDDYFDPDPDRYRD